MHLTSRHLDFWQQRRCPRPAWATRLRSANAVSIDEIVNLNARLRFDYTASNTLALLNAARERGTLRAALVRMATDPGTVIRPTRRAAYCRHWLLKLTGFPVTAIAPGSVAHF